MKYTLHTNGTVIHNEHNKFIPADPANSDYQQYLAWVEAGNTPGTDTPEDKPKRKSKVKVSG